MAGWSAKLDMIEMIRKKLDPDGSGQVDSDELVEVLGEFGFPPEESRRLIAVADIEQVLGNDNGSIRILPFLIWLFKVAPPSLESQDTKSQASVSTFRFRVGTKVLCRTGPNEWSAGIILALGYREAHWPPGKVVPYQVEIDDGKRICVPMDTPKLCRKLVPPWWQEVAGSSRMALREASVGKDINQTDHNGMGILHLAVSLNWLEGLDELVNLKVDVNIHDKSHATALHKAAQQSNAQEIVRKLCASGAELNCQDLNPEYNPDLTSVTFGDAKMHRTPLHYSSERGNVDTMRILIDYQADINIPDGDMMTPLHLAIQEDESSAIELLIHAGADIDRGNLESGMKNSPLMDAAFRSNHSLAKKLIEARANVNQQGKSRMAAIHLAARRGDAKMVQVLLFARADLMQKSDCGTALDLAEKNGGEDLLQILNISKSRQAVGTATSKATMSAAQRAALFID